MSRTAQQATGEQEVDVSGTIFEKFGDRGQFYVLGFELFKENPINGIGLGNFINYHGSLVLHSEYMIQLCELGLIGALIFAVFYIWIGKGLSFCWKYGPDNRKITEAYVAGLLIILFVGFVLFEYANPVIFILLGAIIAYIKNYRRELISKKILKYYEKKFPVMDKRY
jgi:O-antigen ligase